MPGSRQTGASDGSTADESPPDAAGIAASLRTKSTAANDESAGPPGLAAADVVSDIAAPRAGGMPGWLFRLVFGTYSLSLLLIVTSVAAQGRDLAPDRSGRQDPRRADCNAGGVLDVSCTGALSARLPQLSSKSLVVAWNR